MIVTLKEAKKYFRVDHDDEDTIIRKFIRAAETLCEGTLRKAVESCVDKQDASKKSALLCGIFCLSIRFLSVLRRK